MAVALSWGDKMNIRSVALAATMLFCLPALSQEDGAEEIVVTGSRMAGPAGAQVRAQLPSVTILKRADSLLQAVDVENDTRDAKARQSETWQSLRALVQMAGRVPGLSVAIQKDYLVPVTADNFEIPLNDEGERDDTSSARIFVKLALTPQTDVEKAVKSLEAFIASAKGVGRTSFESAGDVALSIVNPERYRPEVVAAIAKSVKDMRQAFGERCQIHLGDLSKRLQWQRSSVSDLTLYLPYEMRIEGC